MIMINKNIYIYNFIFENWFEFYFLFLIYIVCICKKECINIILLNIIVFSKKYEIVCDVCKEKIL